MLSKKEERRIVELEAEVRIMRASLEFAHEEVRRHLARGGTESMWAYLTIERFGIRKVISKILNYLNLEIGRQEEDLMLISKEHKDA